MVREFAVAANVGKPQVAYRETITDAGREDRGALHPPDRRHGPVRPRRASRSSPPAPAAATSSSTRSPAVSSPASTSPRSTPASRRRSRAACVAGYPLVDMRAILTFGSYHDVDSSEMAFKIAGSMAFKKAARQAKPVLLEPIMAVEVVTPEDYMGDVIGDLSSRRGQRRGHGAARHVPRGARRKCPWPRCSATLRTFVRAPRVARRTRCSSTRTSRCPSRSPRRSSSESAASSRAPVHAPSHPTER